MEKLGYKHVETDAEFIARIKKEHPGWSAWGATGETLDWAVHECWNKQRKIVEIFP